MTDDSTDQFSLFCTPTAYLNGHYSHESFLSEQLQFPPTLIYIFELTSPHAFNTFFLSPNFVALVIIPITTGLTDTAATNTGITDTIAKIAVEPTIPPVICNI